MKISGLVLAALLLATGRPAADDDALIGRFPVLGPKLQALAGDLNPAQVKATMARLAAHAETFRAWDPDNAELQTRQKGAMAEIFQLHGAESHKVFAWIQKAGGLEDLSPTLSTTMAAVRNEMVREICHELARRHGEVHRVDFSPAVDMSNDIDHTLKGATPNQTGVALKAEFEEAFQARFRLPPAHLDVATHPYEARVPDWTEARASIHDFVLDYRRGNSLLVPNREAYHLEGANRMEVDRRGADPAQKLWTAYIVDPDRQIQEGSVLRRVDEVKDSAFKRIYRGRRPEARASYMWGVGVGNYCFYQSHGRDLKSAAKYPIRSFAEGPAWKTLVGADPDPNLPLPATYEDMLDQAVERNALFDKAWADHYEGKLEVPKEALREGLLRSLKLRKAKDKIGKVRDQEFGPRALALAGGKAEVFNADRETYLKKAEGEHHALMRELMLFNIRIGLKERALDWLQPKVNPDRLPLPPEVRADPAKLAAEVKEAEKRLRVAALFEIVQGLVDLPAGHSASLIAWLAKNVDPKHVRVIRAVGNIVARKDPVLLQAHERKGPREAARRISIAEEEGRRLELRLGSDLDEVRTRMAEGLREFLADSDALKAALLDLPGNFAAHLGGQIDKGIAEARQAKERTADFFEDPAVRRACLAQWSADLIQGFGFEMRETWTAAEGICRADVKKFNPVRLVNLDNAQSFVTIVRAWQTSGGQTGPVLEAAFGELVGRLPIVSTGMQWGAALEGDPVAGGLVVSSMALPAPMAAAVGTLYCVYSIGSGALEIAVDVVVDNEIRAYYQGSVPDDNLERTPGAAGRLGIRGLLEPVLADLKKRRAELKAELEAGVSAARREDIGRQLSRLQENISGARAHLFSYFDERAPNSLNAQLRLKGIQDLDARDEIKLGSRMSTIRDGAANDPKNLPPFLVAYFRGLARDYAAGAGPYAPWKEALQDLSVREHFLFNAPGSRRGKYEQDVEDRLAFALSISFRDWLLAGRAASAAGADKLPAGEILRGLSAEDVRRFTLNPAAPALPSFLAPFPGATHEEKARRFFGHVDGLMNEALGTMKPRPIPEADWDARKLAQDAATAAPEEAGAELGLLRAYFGRVVAAHIREAEAASGQPYFKNSLLDVDVIRGRIVLQLVKDYKKGLLEDIVRRHEERERAIETEHLRYALARRSILDALRGDEMDEVRRDALRELALHSGDPRVFDDDGHELLLEPLLKTEEKTGQAKILGAEAGLRPGQPLKLRCEVRAPWCYLRPFRTAWSIEVQGKKAERAPLPDAKGNLLVQAIDLGDAATPPPFKVLALVTDARGVEVARAEAEIGGRSPGRLTARSERRSQGAGVAWALQDWHDPTAFDPAVDAVWKSGDREFIRFHLRFDYAGMTVHDARFLQRPFKPADLKELKGFAILPLPRIGTYPCRMTAYAGPAGRPVWQTTFDIVCLENDPYPNAESLSRMDRQAAYFRQQHLAWMKGFEQRKLPRQAAEAWRCLVLEHDTLAERNGWGYALTHGPEQERAQEAVLDLLGGNLVPPGWLEWSSTTLGGGGGSLGQGNGPAPVVGDIVLFSAGESLLRTIVRRHVTRTDDAAVDRWLRRIDRCLDLPEGRKEETPQGFGLGAKGLPLAARDAYRGAIDDALFRRPNPDRAALLIRQAMATGLFTPGTFDTQVQSQKKIRAFYPPEAFR